MAFILISLKNLKTVVKWFQQFREDGLAFCRTWHDSTGSVFALWTLFFFILAQCTRNHYLFSTSKNGTEKGNSCLWYKWKIKRHFVVRKKAGKLAWLFSHIHNIYLHSFKKIPIIKMLYNSCSKFMSYYYSIFHYDLSF